jgi:hypothetical protein
MADEVEDSYLGRQDYVELCLNLTMINKIIYTILQAHGYNFSASLEYAIIKTYDYYEAKSIVAQLLIKFSSSIYPEF